MCTTVGLAANIVRDSSSVIDTTEERFLEADWVRTIFVRITDSPFTKRFFCCPNRNGRIKRRTLLASGNVKGIEPDATRIRELFENFSPRRAQSSTKLGTISRYTGFR
jgi:hypothetical protein